MGYIKYKSYNMQNISNFFSILLLKEKCNHFLYNIFLSFLCVFAFFTPDYILKISGASKVDFEFIFFFAFFIFGLILSMIKSQKVVYIVVGIFFVFECIQLHYMAYFGMPISAPEIKKIFTETHDIAESGFSYFYAVWYVLPTMLITYGTYIYFYHKYSNKCFKTKVAYLFLIIVLLVKPERAYRKTLKNFLPGPTRNSIHNTLNTFSYFFVKELWSNNLQKDIIFQDYIIEKKQNFEKPNIIILLVGESMNFKHLGLYDYERNTTPNLNKLKDNENFIYKKALSSSISTSSALPFLFNIIREPGNFKLLSNKNNNLFKLAKNNDFKTYFITSQESKTLNDVGVNFCDKTITKEDDYIDFTDKKDDNLLEYLDKFLNEENIQNKFISIFQRNLHSPYENNYEEHYNEFNVYNINQKTRKDKMVNSYDNAVLFEDYFINEIINRINKIQDKSIILIITADHGQMLGEDNLYGHNILDYRVAQIPFMIYYNDNYKIGFDKKNIFDNISHYEISKIIANIIGYEVKNPNDDGKYFIQGNNIYFDNFLIPYTRDKNNNLIFDKINTTYQYFENNIK